VLRFCIFELALVNDDSERKDPFLPIEKALLLNVVRAIMKTKNVILYTKANTFTCPN